MIYSSLPKIINQDYYWRLKNPGFFGVYLFSTMYPENAQPVSHQPQLLVFEESIGTVELFPTVWKALEDLTKEDEFQRAAALEQIAELNAARISPVVSYFLVTRIIEPNIKLRARVVEILSSVLIVNEDGIPSPEDVRNSLRIYLTSIRTRQVFSLLQVSAKYPPMEPCIKLLLGTSSFAGNHLVDILDDRKTPLIIRKQAAVMIGQVGYVYTLKALEKIAARLEAHFEGQTTMSFTSQTPSREVELLPLVYEAINALRIQ